MKTSLRTVLIVMSFCASIFAYAAALAGVGHASDLTRLVMAIISFLAMSIGASASCASIALDRVGTRRWAGRAAIYGFAGFIALGILIGLAVPTPT